MAEVLTGKQLRDRADACLDQRKPDKETLRSWIGRGADRIDRLTNEIERLESDLRSGGSEAALMMLEEARQAADKTLDRTRSMEASAETALEDARAAAQTTANDLITAANTEAVQIVAEARQTASRLVEEAEMECQARLESAVAQADTIDEGCRNLVSHANSLDGAYRKRIADIRTEANALVALMERFDNLPISTDYDNLNSAEVVEELVADVVDFKAPERSSHEHGRQTG